MTTEYTETELANILMKYDLKVTQLTTEYFKEKGYLHSRDGVPSFIRTAEQIFTSVKLKINPNSKPDKNGNLRPYAGKKRRYIVGKMRDTIAERKDNRKYNTFKSSPERTAVINKIHESLYKHYSKGKDEQRLSTLIKTLGLQKANQSIQCNTEFIERLRQAYNLNESFPFYKEYEIVKEVTSNYNNSIVDIVEQALNQLSKENKLHYCVYYYGSTSNGEAISITKDNATEHYRLLKEYFSYYFSLYKEDIGEHITFSQFLYRRHYLNLRSEDIQYDNKASLRDYSLRQMYFKIHEKVTQETGLLSVYRRFKINSVAPYSAGTVKENINELFKRHYLRKTKIYRYENYPEYFRESTFFWRRFFYLSATIYLEQADQKLLESFEVDLERYAHDFYSKYYNRRDYLFAEDIDNKIQEHIDYIKDREDLIPKELNSSLTQCTKELFQLSRENI